MQISKSSQNTNKNSQIAFLIAAAIHLPFVLLAMGIDLLPQKPQEPAKELGAMSFSLASFVAEPIEPAIMPTPEIQEIPKYYEPPKKKLNEKKNVQQKPKHLEHRQKTYKNAEQSHAKMTNAALNQDSSMQNHNQAIFFYFTNKYIICAILDAPNTNTAPIKYGINVFLYSALSDTLPNIYFTPKTANTITDTTTPIDIMIETT